MYFTIFSLNSAADSFGPTFKDVLTPIRHDGQVKFVYPANFHTTCTPDIKYFPFDQQVCRLSFSSWAFNLSHLNLTLRVTMDFLKEVFEGVRIIRAIFVISSVRIKNSIQFNFHFFLYDRKFSKKSTKGMSSTTKMF